MKKLLLLLFLIPNLVMAEVTKDCKYVYPETVDAQKFNGFSPYSRLCRVDSLGTFSEEEKKAVKRCEAENERNSFKSSEANREERKCNKKRNAPEREKKRKLQLKIEKSKLKIETKCSIKSGKAKNDFSARQIYKNCLQNNNYYNK